MSPDSAQLLTRVLDAVSLTTEAGTARHRYGGRRDGKLGPLRPEDRAGEGIIDFKQRRAWHSTWQMVKGFPPDAEELWVGTDWFHRVSPASPWEPMPTFGLAPGELPTLSPFWIMDGLRASRHDATAITDDPTDLDGITHIRLTIDRDKARALTPPLNMEPNTAEAIPTEVWLDTQGRLVRMAACLPQLPRWLPRRLVYWARWNITEFWDFGTQAAIPAPPATN